VSFEEKHHGRNEVLSRANERSDNSDPASSPYEKDDKETRPIIKEIDARLLNNSNTALCKYTKIMACLVPSHGSSR
jgi:hypothetical protein